MGMKINYIIIIINIILTMLTMCHWETCSKLIHPINNSLQPLSTHYTLYNSTFQPIVIKQITGTEEVQRNYKKCFISKYNFKTKKDFPRHLGL